MGTCQADSFVILFLHYSPAHQSAPAQQKGMRSRQAGSFKGLLLRCWVAALRSHKSVLTSSASLDSSDVSQVSRGGCCRGPWRGAAQRCARRRLGCQSARTRSSPTAGCPGCVPPSPAAAQTHPDSHRHSGPHSNQPTPDSLARTHYIVHSFQVSLAVFGYTSKALSRKSTREYNTPLCSNTRIEFKALLWYGVAAKRVSSIQEGSICS